MAKKALSKIDLTELNDLGGIDFSLQGGQYSRTKKYYCDAGSVDTLKSQIPATCPDDAELTWLSSITAKSLGAKGVVELTATWTPSYFSAFSERPNGTTEKSVSINSKYVSVDDPALISSGLYTVAQVNNAKKKKLKVLPVGSCKYSITTYMDDFDWKESSIVDLLGTVGKPTGIGESTEKNWFRESTEIQQTGKEQVRKSEVWVYSKVGWNKE